MGNAKIHIDMRTYTSKVRQLVKDRCIESVNAPGVKTAIYTELYDMIIDDIPQDTGALSYSPLADDGAQYMGEGTYNRQPHYASGEINDKGIYFSPYSVSKKTGKETNYASYVKSFRPYVAINDKKSMAYERIKDIIVKEINDG